MNSVTHPWSHNKHTVNSSKMEQSTEAGDHLQICVDLLFFCEPLKRRLIQVGADLADLLNIQAQSKRPCLRVFPAVSVTVSHTVGYKHKLLQLFPEPNCLYGSFIVAIVAHRALTFWPPGPLGSLHDPHRGQREVVTLASRDKEARSRDPTPFKSIASKSIATETFPEYLRFLIPLGLCLFPPRSLLPSLAWIPLTCTWC